MHFSSFTDHQISHLNISIVDTYASDGMQQMQIYKNQCIYGIFLIFYKIRAHYLEKL